MAEKKVKKIPLATNTSFVILLLRRFLMLGSIILTILFLIIVGFWLLFLNRIYPAVYVANLNLSGKRLEQAEQELKSTLQVRLNQSLQFEFQEASISSRFVVNLSSNQSNLKIHQAVLDAYQLGHKRFYLPPERISVDLVFDQESEKQIDEIAQLVDQKAIDAQIKIVDDSINVTASQEGMVLDRQLLKVQLADYVNTGKLLNNRLPIKKVSPKLGYETALKIKKRLDAIKLEPLKLTFGDQTFILDLDRLLSLIDLENTESFFVSANLLDQKVNISSVSVGQTELADTKLTLQKDQIKNYLKEISKQIDRPVEEPLFSFDGSRVIEFKPPQEGYSLDINKATDRLTNALLSHDQKIVNLPVAVISPKNKLTNELGIKELIGRGISNFSGSIENRIYNIKLGASKINGLLVGPGEEFSFNKAVGDISASTGFKQAYVIKSGRTVLDDGGGICQVSTTLFRAVLNSGLPVTARTAHAYRVGYYELGFPPGLDATIFYPSVDFKFKNDTTSHILIQAYVVGTSLYVDFYGTLDGRVVNISTPVVTNQTPPPPELRQDDPTLPKGTVKQVDWAAWGANVVFIRTVTKAGQLLSKDTFRSNFRPWQAVFLVGTKEN
ncbi:VanW family protein [Candidatus Daviesbacteria bacterium]|nr:VanW family protein [Candidatus Daviesbacteria bacterium]